jgi:hypothetical protein
MKVKVLEPISDSNGHENGFGDKAVIGEIFELEDVRAEELIKKGYVSKVEETVKAENAKK